MNSPEQSYTYKGNLQIIDDFRPRSCNRGLNCSHKTSISLQLLSNSCTLLPVFHIKREQIHFRWRGSRQQIKTTPSIRSRSNIFRFMTAALRLLSISRNLPTFDRFDFSSGETALDAHSSAPLPICTGPQNSRALECHHFSGRQSHGLARLRVSTVTLMLLFY